MGFLTTLPILNDAECRAADTQKGIELLRLAIQKKELPSRKEHASLALRTLAYELFAVIANVAGAVLWPTITLLAHPFSKNPAARPYLKYTLIETVSLSPLYLCSRLIMGVLKTLSVASGVCFPKLAANGWILAEQLRLQNLKVQGAFLRYFLPPTNRLTLTCTDPSDAQRYLSKPKLIALHKSLKNPERITKEETAVRIAFASILAHLNAAPLVKEKLYAEKGDNAPHVSEFITRSKNSSEARRLRPEEITSIFDHFSLRLLQGQLKTYESNGEIRKALAEFEVETKEDFTKMRYALAEFDRFGATTQYW